MSEHNTFLSFLLFVFTNAGNGDIFNILTVNAHIKRHWLHIFVSTVCSQTRGTEDICYFIYICNRVYCVFQAMIL